jgi:hypothetical protein
MHHRRSSLRSTKTTKINRGTYLPPTFWEKNLDEGLKKHESWKDCMIIPPNLITCTHQQLTLSSFSKPLHPKKYLMERTEKTQQAK